MLVRVWIGGREKERERERAEAEGEERKGRRRSGEGVEEGERQSRTGRWQEVPDERGNETERETTGVLAMLYAGGG